MIDYEYCCLFLSILSPISLPHISTIPSSPHFHTFTHISTPFTISGSGCPVCCLSWKPSGGGGGGVVVIIRDNIIFPVFLGELTWSNRTIQSENNNSSIVKHSSFYSVDIYHIIFLVSIYPSYTLYTRSSRYILDSVNIIILEIVNTIWRVDGVRYAHLPSYFEINFSIGEDIGLKKSQEISIIDLYYIFNYRVPRSCSNSLQKSHVVNLA